VKFFEITHNHRRGCIMTRGQSHTRRQLQKYANTLARTHSCMRAILNTHKNSHFGTDNKMHTVTHIQ